MVDSCGLIRVDNVAYRVPDALIGKKVQVLISEETIKVFSPGETTIELDKGSQVYRPTESSERDSEDSVVVFDANDPHRQNPLQRTLNQYDELTDWSTPL